MGLCYKCKFSGPTPDLLNQKLGDRGWRLKGRGGNEGQQRFNKSSNSDCNAHLSLRNAALDNSFENR